MVKKLQKRAAKKRKQPIWLSPHLTPAEQKRERLLRKATIHLIMHVGGLLVATGLREEKFHGARRWIIEVTLRYPTGHEGYVGELEYDGKEFRILTPASTWRQRIKKIAADPEGIRLWNEYRASTLRSGKA